MAELPYELLEEILFYFCHPKAVHVATLEKLSLVSRSFRDICRPAIFRDLVLQPSPAVHVPEDGSSSEQVDRLEHCRKLLATLQSSPQLWEYVHSLKVVDANLSDSSWLIPEYELVCSFLDTCGSLETLTVTATSTADIIWDSLPLPLRASLSRVFASPSLRTLDLHARLTVHDTTELTVVFPMRADSGLRNLTLTDVMFTDDVPRASDADQLGNFNAPGGHIQKQLDSLSINYVDAFFRGPKLVSALLNDNTSPFGIKRLSAFIITGLSDLDRWVCDVLDAQETSETLRKFGLHGIFSIEQLPFTRNLERFSHITELSADNYPTVSRQEWAELFKRSLDATPRQVLNTLQKLTFFAPDDIDFSDWKGVDAYCKSDMTPSLEVCQLVLESAAKPDDPEVLSLLTARVVEALPLAAARGLLKVVVVEWGYIPNMEYD